MRVSLLLCLIFGASIAFGAYVDYEIVDYNDFDTMGAGGPPGLGGFGAGKGGFGGLGANIQFIPLTQHQVAQPIVQSKQFMQQPILQEEQQQFLQQPVFQQEQPLIQNTKPIKYNQPIVTYAQPIVSQVDMSAPVVQKQKLTAEAIVQPTFNTAPITYQQAITSTAPTIQKGFGAGLGLNQQYAGNLGYGGYAQQQPVLARNYGLQQQGLAAGGKQGYGGLGMKYGANVRAGMGFGQGQQFGGMNNEEMDMGF